MGEAKRRKLLDPNYGKENRLTFGDLSPLFFEKYGRGIFINKPRKSFVYVINCEYLLDKIDRKYLSTYDPEKEVIIIEYLSGDKGLSYLWKGFNSECKFRINGTKADIDTIMNNSESLVHDIKLIDISRG